jgi:hypothetical protein
MGKKRKYFWLVLAVLIAVSTSAAVALWTPSHSRLCDLKSSDLYGKVANSHPLPNNVKSVVLCHLHSDFGGGDGAWVKSFDVPQPRKFANLLNQAKRSSGIACAVGFSDSALIIATLTNGERVVLNQINCGPLLSSYSSLSFEMPAAAQAVLKKLDPTFNWNL